MKFHIKSPASTVAESVLSIHVYVLQKMASDNRDIVCEGENILHFCSVPMLQSLMSKRFSYRYSQMPRILIVFLSVVTAEISVDLALVR